MLIENILIYSSLLCLILFIWFKTSAFVEYCSLLRFKKIFYIKEFKKKNELSGELTYTDFLSIYKDCFLSRLISCPPCLSIWVGAALYFAHYKIELIPLSIIFGLMFFYLLSVLERRSYE